MENSLNKFDDFDREIKYAVVSHYEDNDESSLSIKTLLVI